jgi:hypothetical protein
MPDLASFDYAIVRVVPRVERAEFVNVGVIIFCRTMAILDARIALDAERLRTIAPSIDLEEVERHLQLIPLICRGGSDGGPIGLLSPSERFHWLTAPRSTVIQTSPVHSGLCTDTVTALEQILRQAVT